MRAKKLYVIEVKTGKLPWQPALEHTTTHYAVALRAKKLFNAPKSGWQARIVTYVPKEAP